MLPALGVCDYFVLLLGTAAPGRDVKLTLLLPAEDCRRKPVPILELAF